MTSRGEWTTELYQTALKVLPLAIDSVIQTGIVVDKIYDDNGIPDDKDMYGRVRRRDFTIVNECRQRAKSINYPKQRELRINQIQTVLRTKQLEYDDKVGAVNKVSPVNVNTHNYYILGSHSEIPHTQPGTCRQPTCRRITCEF